MTIRPFCISTGAGFGFYLGEQRKWTSQSAWTVYVVYIIVWRIKVGTEIS